MMNNERLFPRNTPMTVLEEVDFTSLAILQVVGSQSRRSRTMAETALFRER